MSKEPEYGEKSLSKGMWHQYGDQIKDSEGIWMSISDVPETPLYSKGCSETSPSNECLFTGRPENVVSLKKTNAEVILYIRDYQELLTLTITIDGTVITEFTNLINNPGAKSWPSILEFAAETNNLTTATNIAQAINGRCYVYSTTAFYDDTYGSNPAGIPLAWRMQASVFTPETHPWINNGDAAQDPVVAIKIQFIDALAPAWADGWAAGGLGGVARSPGPAVTFYPDYYASGVLGNSRIASIGPAPLGWLLLGNDLFVDEKRFANSVRFRNGASPQYNVKSLADLVGFSKETRRLGEVAEKQKIKEAIVAIPFVEKSGHKQFFRVPRFEVDRAEFDRDAVGKSVLKMVDLMKQYVFPPRLDFLTNRQIEPFAMYIFEFEIELTKRDLQDIWQNLLPQVKVEIQESIFSHKLNEKEFFGMGSGLESSLRWFVFKVKQKANWNYFAITADSTDDKRYKFNVSGDNRTGKKVDSLPYSYNWPYDYCSIVELAKMDVKVKIEKKGVKVEQLANLAPSSPVITPTAAAAPSVSKEKLARNLSKKTTKSGR